MANHAVLSPSSAKRWMNCPGSVVLSDRLPNTSSSFADEGTAAHFLASECLIYEGDAIDYKDEVIVVGSTDQFFESDPSRAVEEGSSKFTVDDDMAAGVQVYLDYVRDVQTSTNGDLFVEVRVPLTHLTKEEDAWGTSDAVIITSDEVIVIDLKFGRGVEVSAEDNEQLLMYASGTMKHFAPLGLEGVKTVRVAISQPRLTMAPSEWSCTVEDLKRFETRVQECAKFVDQAREHPDRTVNYSPSEDACRWCKAKATCPALAAKVQDTIGADFDDLLISPPPKVDQAGGLLASKMACVDLIEDWCKAVRAKVESELLTGNDVPGWKLVQGRKGARAWSNAEEAEAVMKSMRLKTDQMYDFKLISPTTAEKVLSPTPKRWTRVQELITQSEGKPSVAPVTDKRPALVVTPVEDDFENLDELV